MPVKLPAHPLVDRPRNFVGGFREFIRDYGVLPLAIGVVIGTAVNDLVKSLVDGLITPFIALISPQSRLQNLQFTFHGAVFKVGLVLNATISFLVVAFVVYFAVTRLLRNQEILKKK